MKEYNDILAAIKRVINRRRRRGAKEDDIQEYKKHLLEIWKNPGLQKEILKLWGRKSGEETGNVPFVLVRPIDWIGRLSQDAVAVGM